MRSCVGLQVGNQLPKRSGVGFLDFGRSGLGRLRDSSRDSTGFGAFRGWNNVRLFAVNGEAIRFRDLQARLSYSFEDVRLVTFPNLGEERVDSLARASIS